MNKTGKTKSLRDFPIWMYQSLWLKMISKVKLSSIQLLMNRKKAGKKDLANFVLPHSTNALSYLLENTWKMESASKKIFYSKQTRMELIHEHSHGRCADSFSEEWSNCALEVLQENDIYPPYFSTAGLILS